MRGPSPHTGQDLHGLNFLPVLKKGAYGFLLNCQDVGQKGKGESQGLNVVSHQIPKMASDSLLQSTREPGEPGS